MQQHGRLQANKRAKSKQLRGVQLADRAELLPAAGRSAAAHEETRYGPQWSTTAAFR